MQNLKFSVSMCVYHGDHADYFDEALASVFNQTRQPDEVVLTVDGPVSSEIDAVITKYQTKKGMKVVRLEKNMGHGIARRTGFANCTHEFVAIADADDVNVPTRFEKQLKCFEDNPALSAVSSSCYHFIGTTSNILYEVQLPETDSDIKKYMQKRCPLVNAAIMLRKSDVEKAGGYQEWYHAEDYYLWLRMYLTGAVFANVHESLLYVRSNPDYVNRRGGWKYFNSMVRLFSFMFKNKIIGLPIYVYNIVTRFVAQVLLPNKARGWLRKIVDHGDGKNT